MLFRHIKSNIVMFRYSYDTSYQSEHMKVVVIRDIFLDVSVLNFLVCSFNMFFKDHVNKDVFFLINLSNVVLHILRHVNYESTARVVLLDDFVQHLDKNVVYYLDNTAQQQLTYSVSFSGSLHHTMSNLLFSSEKSISLYVFFISMYMPRLLSYKI